jgi:hypothetical protein
LFSTGLQVRVVVHRVLFPFSLPPPFSIFRRARHRRFYGKYWFIGGKPAKLAQGKI